MIEDLTGGRSFQGLAEGSNESGVSVEAKKTQGVLVALNFIDNLIQYKRLVGENIISWVNLYENAERVIKIEGEDLSPEMMQLLKENNIDIKSRYDGGGYIKANDENNELTFLKDAKFELEIIEVALTETMRAMKRMEVFEAEKQNPMLNQSPAWNAYKLEVMDIPHDVRTKVLQETQQIMQAQAQSAQQAQEIETQKLRNDTARVMIDQMKAESNIKQSGQKKEKESA